MASVESLLKSVKPRVALQQIADAIPEGCHAHMIVIGSLAVGYRYYANNEEIAVRTKDVDCLLSPRGQAVPAGKAITERLLSDDWQLDGNSKWTEPGTAATPDDKLPVIRLKPPAESEWFLELLTVPESPTDRSRRWTRLPPTQGHFVLPSFGYLALANLDPQPTNFGISIARPEMMVLANLLEHPIIESDLMSGGFHERSDIKRSNKDLGRVIAIARLAVREDEDALLEWPELWREALKARFPSEHQELASQAGTGLRALLASEPDFEQAWYTCYYGVLNALAPTIGQLRTAGERLLADAVEPLERAAHDLDV